MDLSKLSKTTDKKLRRLGQGHGSGRGKTGGRGTKGQKARNTVPTFFEGGALPLTKRLPFLRGRGRNKGIGVKPVAVTVEVLNNLPAKSVVDVELLVKNSVVDSKAKIAGVKVIGNGKVASALTVKLPVSAGAKKAIEAAGGKVEL